jgi:hypothetical protein
MANSVFQINKGINRPIEFRGLKAQYILYFVAGVLALLVLFAIMYILGLNSYICVGVILALGTGLTVQLYAMSNKYGEHGLTKKLAKRNIPKVVTNHSKQIFRQHKNSGNG